jgi:hypothetical protein
VTRTRVNPRGPHLGYPSTGHIEVATGDHIQRTTYSGPTTWDQYSELPTGDSLQGTT